MVQNQENKKYRVLKFVIFAFAVFLGILSCFLVLDAFLPKERHVAILVPVAEVLAGALLLIIAFVIGRKNRLTGKQVDH